VSLARSKLTIAASLVCLLSSVFLADGGGRAAAWCVLALVLPLARRLPGLALAAALGALYLRYSGHSDVFYPSIDWIRVRGMDLWPGLLQVGGLIIVYSTGMAALSRGRRGLQVVLLVGALLSAGWWGFPGHFNLDVVGAAGGSPVPVVVDGRITRRQWERQVLPATGADAWPAVMQSERTLSGIAHGMGQVTHRSHGVLRSTLWGGLVPMAVAHQLLTVLSSAVGLLLVVLSGLGGPIRAVGFWAWRILGLTLFLPPVLNILLRVIGAIGGLEEAAVDLPLALLNAAVTLVVVFLARSAGAQWSD
jgi:hypothetical protein